MFHLLIDTCVWLDLAKDPAQQPLLSALEELVSANQVSLILPQTILDEFARNRNRIIVESNRGLSGVIRRAKIAVDKFGDPTEKLRVMAQLDDLDHKLPQIGDTATESVSRIENLFSASKTISITTETLARAAQRAVDRRAPFHRDKNSVNDAILVEVYRASTNRLMRLTQPPHASPLTALGPIQNPAAPGFHPEGLDDPEGYGLRQNPVVPV